MRAVIVIDCDEDNEIAQHLDKLRKDFTKAAKQQKITENFALEDNNCYGNHAAIVTDYE